MEPSIGRPIRSASWGRPSVQSASPVVPVLPTLTGMGDARNAINALTSDALIAISGGVGTPVVGLETWQVTPADTPPNRESTGSRAPGKLLAWPSAWLLLAGR